MGTRSWVVSPRSPMYTRHIYVGVSNGSIQFESARKIWPLLELLAKIR